SGRRGYDKYRLKMVAELRGIRDVTSGHVTSVDLVCVQLVACAVRRGQHPGWSIAEQKSSAGVVVLPKFYPDDFDKGVVPNHPSPGIFQLKSIAGWRRGLSSPLRMRGRSSAYRSDRCNHGQRSKQVAHSGCSRPLEIAIDDVLTIADRILSLLRRRICETFREARSGSVG